jgi:hypothetical protein
MAMAASTVTATNATATTPILARRRKLSNFRHQRAVEAVRCTVRVVKGDPNPIRARESNGRRITAIFVFAKPWNRLTSRSVI